MRPVAHIKTLAVVALVAVGLAACGSSTTTTTTVQPTSVASTQATTAVTPAANSTDATSAPSITNATAAESAAATTTKLNLNTVTEEELMATIPDFSSRMVREFMEYRPYVSIQQFRKEIGKYVSAEQVTAYEQYVYVPVDVNQADAATLQQLPGVDATVADTLIAARPYDTTEVFLSKLGEYVSAADVQQAQTYIAAS